MIFSSVIFGLLAALGWGISDLIAAALSKRLGVLQTAVAVSIVSVSVASTFLILTSNIDELSAKDWTILAGISVLGSALYLTYYKALQLGPVAIISPISASYALVVILLAVIFMNERLTTGQAIGASATIGGVVLASLNLDGLRSRQKLVNTGVTLGLIATLGMGLWQFSIGVLSKDLGWFWPVYITRLLTLVTLTPIAIFLGRWPWRQTTGLLIVGIILTGIFEIGGLFAFTRGAELGIISIVAASSTVYPIIPIIGGLVLFQERIGLTQVAGIVIVLSGVGILSLNA